jgi:hypothetical protein
MIIKRYPIFVLLLVTLVLQLITACSPSTQDMQGERWVVFPAEQARKLGIGDWLLSGGDTAEYWTPSEKDVLALENGLASYLQDNPGRFVKQGTPVWERLDDYDRQYIGIILDGKMIVYANYFCNSMETNWRKDFIFVLDGGECYFQFKYDADSGEFFDLQVNGDA